MGGMEARDTYKIEAALKYVKGKLAEYCSEERSNTMLYYIQCTTVLCFLSPLHAQVLGHAPYTNYCYLTTHALAHKMICMPLKK